MIRWYLRAAPLALVLLQTACTQAPAPPPPDTRAADEKAIRDAEAQWAKDVAAKDLDKDVGHYADDASVLLANQPLLNKEQIRTLYAKQNADPNLALEFAPSKVVVSKGGDLAFSQGAYTLTTTNPKTKKPMMEKGKYLEVYQKQADGSWKVVEDATNADAPAKPSARTGATPRRTKRKSSK